MNDLLPVYLSQALSSPQHGADKVPDMRNLSFFIISSGVLLKKGCVIRVQR
ncbi:uncharacterized, partial [Tachysurus ichikawai]